MTLPSVVLASGSPRRRQLLEMLGIAFDVMPASVDEAPLEGESARQMAQRLARAKARAVALRRPDAYVIGSDTVVVLDRDVLGKPADAVDAATMLMRLQGRVHRVETGIAVVAPDGRTQSSGVGVDVRVRAFDRPFAEAYVATGEPMDKAGAYGIQGLGAALVERIDGDFYAVMGLPITALLQHLGRLGLQYRFSGLYAERP